jgi:CheY-like chemotaxis protein
MDILIVEDEALLGLLLGDALTDVGHRVLGPAADAAEAMARLGEGTPHLAFVDIELRGGDSGIKVAHDLHQRGVPCVFATGQPERARAHRELALGLVCKPYNPMTIVEVARYIAAIAAGDRVARPPRGFENFISNPAPDTVPAVDSASPILGDEPSSRALGAPVASAASAAGISRPRENRPRAGALAALAG